MNTYVTLGVAVAVCASVIAALGVFWTAMLIGALTIGIAILLIINQESILYIPVVMGYKRVADNPEGYRSPEEYDAAYKEFFVTTKDGEKIHGWHIHRSKEDSVTVIFCHENAGNIGLRVNNLVAMSNQLDADVVAFDYRGYGDSTGKPSEEGLMADTDAVFKYTVNELHAKKIFLYGRSLGGAVALQYAAVVGEDAPLLGVVAENTFTSIADMIGAVLPFLNFQVVKKYCLRLKWDTHEWVRLIQCPVLLLSGLKDEIVPSHHMETLKKICDEHKIKAQLVTFPEGTHNDTWVVGGQAYWVAIRTFVNRLV